MRIAATVAAFVFATLVVGLIRMGLTGPLGFIGGAVVGLIYMGLFFGLPYLVWKAMTPKK